MCEIRNISGLFGLKRKIAGNRSPDDFFQFHDFPRVSKNGALFLLNLFLALAHAHANEGEWERQCEGPLPSYLLLRAFHVLFIPI